MKNVFFQTKIMEMLIGTLIASLIAPIIPTVVVVVNDYHNRKLQKAKPICDLIKEHREAMDALNYARKTPNTTADELKSREITVSLCKQVFDKRLTEIGIENAWVGSRLLRTIINNFERFRIKPNEKDNVTQKIEENKNAS